MPLQWVEPEVFVEHKGRKVYHTYKNDDIENVNSYWFNTDVTESEQGEWHFDIRRLSTYEKGKRCDLVIKEAIDKREIYWPGDK